MRSPKARAVRSARMRAAFSRSRDANEPGIIYAVRTAGWFVAKLDGTGLPDLLCLHRDGARAVLLEVKVPGGRRLKSGRLTQAGRLTPAQLATHERLARAGWYVHVVRTPEEALGALESRATPDNCHKDMGGTRRVRITRPVKPPATDEEARKQLEAAGVDVEAFLERTRQHVAAVRARLEEETP